LRACSQAGLVNNLNDALAWGLAPLYLAAHGSSLREVAVVAAAYPVVWGAGQLVTGWISDHTGRKSLIAAGMIVQAGALGLLVAGHGAFAPSLAAALLLGAGTAIVYPTLIAAVSDASQPRDRARVVNANGDPDRPCAHRRQRCVGSLRRHGNRGARFGLPPFPKRKERGPDGRRTRPL